MMRRFKDEFRSSPVKYTFGFLVLFLLAAVFFYQMRDYITWLALGKKGAEKLKQELLNAQGKLKGELNARHRLLERRKFFVSNSGNFWIPQRDGDTGMNIQKMLNKAAEESGVVLASVGVARIEKVTDGISLVNLSIRAQGQSKNIMDFVNETGKMRPSALWKSLVIRPENPASASDLVISGNIQFILITDDTIATLLQGDS